MEIYVKPVKKTLIYEQKKIFLKDIAEIYAPKEILDKLNKLVLFEVSDKPKPNYLITILDIISAIDKALPGHTISNVGEMDTVIDYSPKKSKDNAIWKWCKVAFVTILLLAGSTTAIMSFQSDAQLPEIFKNYYEIFFDITSGKTALIDIPYSLGIAVGILVFFNHFLGKEVTDDPTPIEVEMTLYETSVTDTMIDVLNTKRFNHKSTDSVKDKDKKHGGKP